jgi:hypothetical protein
MAVYFHSNFGLNRPQMAGVLGRSLENSKMRDEELAKPFGYHAPFAAKQRAWLQKTGIIGTGFPVKLSELGQVVYEHDPQLENSVTLWFMHYQLTEPPDNADAWHFFFKKFLPGKMRNFRTLCRTGIVKHFLA